MVSIFYPQGLDFSEPITRKAQPHSPPYTCQVSTCKIGDRRAVHLADLMRDSLRRHLPAATSSRFPFLPATAFRKNSFPQEEQRKKTPKRFHENAIEKKGKGMDICSYKPHVAMTLSQLCLSILFILRQSLFSKGISPLVMVVYEHVLSTVLLSALAFFLEKEVRPPLSLRMLCNAFFLGLLQTPLGQMLLSLSLKFNTVTVQSVAVNMIPIVVFMLAVVFRQETFQFRRFHGQAKLWGVVISTSGAMAMLLWKRSVLMNELASATFKVTRHEVIGCSLLVVAVLSSASWNISLRHVSKKYPATLSLTAMMCFFGTIQGAVITAVAVRRAAWKLQWEGGLVLFVILYGSILVSGAIHYIRTWCIQKKGPVFPEAFSPLLIVSSFLVDTILIGNPAHLGSFVGAFLIVGGLYLLLWGKAKDRDMECTLHEASAKAPLLRDWR